MAPVYKFRSPAGVISDITTYFRLYKLDVATNAEEGSVAQSKVQADDPSGAFDIVGHRIFQITEDTATSSNTHIYVGYTAGRRVSRGDYHRTSTGRVWDIDLVDINSVLSRRVMTGTDANRPAETDVQRVQWLLTTNEASIIDDSLYLSTTGPIAMDAADYRGQKFNQVLDDCAQASGKNHYVWYREETGTFSLWYDFATSTNYSSPLRLSNVSTEVDSVLTFALSNDTELSRSPDRVNSGAYLPFDGGSVYSQLTATANAFAERDAVMPSENVKTTTKATARAARYLTEMSTEEDVITTTVQLPAAQVNFLMQGMRVQLKASHLPGYETFSWCRVLNRSVQQVSEEWYDVKLDLSPATAAPCSGAGPVLAQSAASPFAAGTGTFALSAAPTAGSLLVLILSHVNTDTIVTAGWTRLHQVDGGTIKFVRRLLDVWTRVAQTGDPASWSLLNPSGNIDNGYWVGEFTCAAVDTFAYGLTVQTAGGTGPADTVTVAVSPSATGGPVLVLAGGLSVDGDTPAVTGLTWTGDLTEQVEQFGGTGGENRMGVAWVIDPTANASYSATVTGTGAFDPGGSAMTSMISVVLK